MTGWWRRKRGGDRPERPVETITLGPLESARLLFAGARTNLGDEHRETVAAGRRLGRLLSHETGRQAEAVEVLHWVARQSHRVLGPEDPATLRALYEAGDCHYGAGDWELAESMLRDALAGQERVLGPDHADTQTTLHGLAAVLTALDRHAESAALRAELDGRRARSGTRDARQQLVDRNHRADALRAAGDLEQAAVLFRDLVADNDAVYGEGSERSAVARSNLAATLFQLGERVEAAAMFREVLDRIDGVPEHRVFAAAVRNNLATVLYFQQRYREAEPLLRASVAERERSLGPDHPDTIGSLANLARVQAALGRPVEAERMASRCLDHYRVRLPAHHRRITELEEFLAEL